MDSAEFREGHRVSLLQVKCCSIVSLIAGRDPVRHSESREASFRRMYRQMLELRIVINVLLEYPSTFNRGEGMRSYLISTVHFNITCLSLLFSQALGKLSLSGLNVNANAIHCYYVWSSSTPQDTS